MRAIFWKISPRQYLYQRKCKPKTSIPMKKWPTNLVNDQVNGAILPSRRSNECETRWRLYPEIRTQYQYHKPKVMMTSSNGKTFRVTGPLWEESTGHRWIPLPKASDAELWCYFDLRLKKRLGQQSSRRWLETPSRLLWRHCNVSNYLIFSARPAHAYPWDIKYTAVSVW